MDRYSRNFALTFGSSRSESARPELVHKPPAYWFSSSGQPSVVLGLLGPSSHSVASHTSSLNSLATGIPSIPQKVRTCSTRTRRSPRAPPAERHPHELQRTDRPPSAVARRKSEAYLESGEAKQLVFPSENGFGFGFA